MATKEVNLRDYLKNRWTKSHLYHLLFLLFVPILILLVGETIWLIQTTKPVRFLLDSRWVVLSYFSILLAFLLNGTVIREFRIRVKNTRTTTWIEILIVSLLVIIPIWSFMHPGNPGLLPPLSSFPIITPNETWNVILNMTLLSAIFVALIGYRQSDKGKQSDPTSEEFFPLSDNPIASPCEDELERNSFAENIAARLLISKQKTSIIYGLSGEWGVGKSSIMQIIKPKIEKEKDVCLVEFSPWLAGDQETILRDFLNVIANAINKNQYFPEISRNFQQYEELLVKHISSKYMDISSLMKNTSIRQKHDEINQAIQRSEYRFIVFIDDLDRLEPTEIKFVLKMVLLCTDFPSFRYVLAFDPLIVSNVYAVNKSGKDFIAKIVQIEIPIPKPEEALMEKYFKNKFVKIPEVHKIATKDWDKNAIEKVYDRALREKLGTIREIKRFLNSVFTNIAPIKNDVFFNDFLILEAIRMYFIKAYEEIYRNKEHFFVARWSKENEIRALMHAMDSTHKKILKDYYEKFIFEHAGNEPVVLKILIVALFPHIAEYLAGGSIGLQRKQDEALKEKRIYHPDIFENYFLAKIPTDQISSIEILAFIEHIKNGNDVGNRRLLIDTLNAFSKKGLKNKFLEDLRANSQMSFGDAGTKFIIALSQVSSQQFKLPECKDEMFSAIEIIYSVANNEHNSNEFEKKIEQAIRESTSINLAASLIITVRNRRNTAIDPSKEKILKNLRHTMTEKFTEEFIDGGKDLFEETGDYYNEVLEEIEMSDKIKKYFYEIISKHNEYLYNLLTPFLTTSEIDEVIVYEFDYDTLKKQYDVSKLASCLSDELRGSASQIINNVESYQLSPNTKQLTIDSEPEQKKAWALIEFDRLYKDEKSKK